MQEPKPKLTFKDEIDAKLSYRDQPYWVDYHLRALRQAFDKIDHGVKTQNIGLVGIAQAEANQHLRSLEALLPPSTK